jgi:hypothetical protein
MDYDVPNLEQKLQSFRTLPAKDILELASNVFNNDDFLKNIWVASIILIEFFASSLPYLLEYSLPSNTPRDAAPLSWQISIDVILYQDKKSKLI